MRRGIMKKLLKSVLCVFLILLLVLPAALSAMANTGDGLSVWVAADLHYRPQSALEPIETQNNLPGDPLYSHVNTKSMLTYEADAIIDEFLSRFEASSVDYLLIPGDLSEDGHWVEHLAIAQKLRDFKARSGKKIYLIPGNHDIRTSASKNRLDLSDFLEIYSDIGYDDTLARHDGTASYTAELDGKYRLLAIDACIYREDGAEIGPDLLAWVEEQTITAKRDGKMLVGMIHHHLLEHFSIEGIAGNLLCVDNYRSLAEQFADWGIKYFFSGHGHANDISAATTKKGNRIFDIETGCLIAYPNAYREVRFSDAAVDIETKYVDKVDISLLPDGYSGEQLELIENDFPAYSYGYFKAGIRSFAYEVPFAVNKIAKSLKIKEGTVQHNALNEVMNTLGEALKLPLYDDEGTPETDSVEEIAQMAGISIERSDYKDVLEIAGAVYAGHYAGDENIDFNSLEVRLLGRGLNAVLVYAFMNIPLRTANILFAQLGIQSSGFSINDSIYGLAAKKIYMKSAAKIIVNSLIRSVADGIINDFSAPGDLNVSLEPYGETHTLTGPTVAITNASYIFSIIFRFIMAFVNSLKAFMM